MCFQHTTILGFYSAAFEGTIQIKVDLSGTIGKSVSNDIFEVLGVGVTGRKSIDIGRRQCSSVGERCDERRDDSDGCELHCGRLREWMSFEGIGVCWNDVL